MGPCAERTWMHPLVDETKSRPSTVACGDGSLFGPLIHHEENALCRKIACDPVQQLLRRKQRERKPPRKDRRRCDKRKPGGDHIRLALHRAIVRDQK